MSIFLSWLFVQIERLMARLGKVLHWNMASLDNQPVIAEVATPTAVAPKTPLPAPIDPKASTTTFYTWDSPKHAYHNVRILCDKNGLSLAEKNIICACIYQESQFMNYLADGKPTIHQNFVNGQLASTDWGICQINDYWHVKKYHDFPSSTFIMSNPDKAVQFMITAYKSGGLSQWVSYSSSAYKQWLSPSSPLWALGS